MRAQTVDGQKNERAPLLHHLYPLSPTSQGCGKPAAKIKSALSFILSDFRGTPLRLNSEMKGGRGSPFMKYPFVFLSIYSPRFRVVSQAIAQTKFQYGAGCAALRSTMLALSSAVVSKCAWTSPVPGRVLGPLGQAGWGEASA